jgi:hypothetical protein
MYQLEEQDKNMNGTMTFHKTKFYITKGSFLGLVNCLYKRGGRKKKKKKKDPNQNITE